MKSVKSNIIFIVLYWFKICGLLHTSKVSNRMRRMGGGGGGKMAFLCKDGWC